MNGMDQSDSMASQKTGVKLSVSQSDGTGNSISDVDKHLDK